MKAPGEKETAGKTVKDKSRSDKKSQSAFPRSGSVNLSVLVDEAITRFIDQRPQLKATFEIENNLVVRGDYPLLKRFVEKVIEYSISFNQASTHHSIVFGRAKDSIQTYFLMNSEPCIGSPSQVSFGAFRYLDQKDLGISTDEVQQIIAGHNGRFWCIGQKDIGSIFYFSIGA